MKKEIDEKLREAFGTVLRRRRGALGISQEELAGRAEITMRYVSLLETGRRQPTIDTLYGIAVALGISFADFARDIEDEYQKGR